MYRKKQSFQMKKKMRKTHKVIEEEEDSDFDSDLEFHTAIGKIMYHFYSILMTGRRMSR